MHDPFVARIPRGIYIGESHTILGRTCTRLCGLSCTVDNTDDETAHLNDAVLSLQINGERAFAVPTVTCATVFRLAAFVHHYVCFSCTLRGSRHFRRARIPGDRDRQGAVCLVAVLVKGPVIENQVGKPRLRHIVVRIKRKAVAAVLLKRQGPHTHTVTQHPVIFQRIFVVCHIQPFHTTRAVGTGMHIVDHRATDRGIRPFLHSNAVFTGRQNVVMHFHGERARGHITRGVRHFDGKRPFQAGICR